MKAITIHQPWASLIAIGAKRFETRGWKTNYRGPIAIHAGKHRDDDTCLMLASKYVRTWREITPMPRGSIVAIAELVGCWEIGGATSSYGTGYGYKSIGVGDTARLISPHGNEQLFGDWTVGRFAWELTDVRQIEPILAKGQQGLWNWREDGTTHEHG